MIEYIIKFLCISLIVLSEVSLARNFDIKQQKHFFCLLEKYNQCFYSGQCSQKEYIKYTNYFNNLIEYSSDAGIELYKEIPKIYEKSEDYQNQNNKGSQLKNFYIGRLFDFNIKEQQNFFCNLEKYDQCFYQGKCKYKDYVNYTEYFTQITGDTLESTKHLYDSLPQIYRWSNKYYKGFKSYLVYDQNALFGLAYKYIILKYKWLSWYKNVTGISYKNPVDIFSKNNKMCGAKIFKKYLSLPLPEDADVETCFFNYEIDDPWCKPDDKLLMRNLFCKSGKNCEIRW